MAHAPQHAQDPLSRRQRSTRLVVNEINTAHAFISDSESTAVCMGRNSVIVLVYS